MALSKRILSIGNHECTIYYNATAYDNLSAKPKYLLVQPVDSHDLEETDKEISYIEKNCDADFIFVGFRIMKWNEELTPWPAPPVFGKIPFGDKAPITLLYIIEELIPKIKEDFEFQEEQLKIILGGYSLAGLFAMWAAYHCDRFFATVSASPSAWYPEWLEYAERRQPVVQNAYLSLGDKEEKSKTKIMSTVAACVRKQLELYEKANVNTVLEWNEGNHFQDNGERTAKGFVWAMTKGKCEPHCSRFCNASFQSNL